MKKNNLSPRSHSDRVGRPWRGALLVLALLVLSAVPSPAEELAPPPGQAKEAAPAAVPPTPREAKPPAESPPEFSRTLGEGSGCRNSRVAFERSRLSRCQPTTTDGCSPP